TAAIARPVLLVHRNWKRARLLAYPVTPVSRYPGTKLDLALVAGAGRDPGERRSRLRDLVVPRIDVHGAGEPLVRRVDAQLHQVFVRPDDLQVDAVIEHVIRDAGRWV